MIYLIATTLIAVPKLFCCVSTTLQTYGGPWMVVHRFVFDKHKSEKQGSVVSFSVQIDMHKEKRKKRFSVLFLNGSMFNFFLIFFYSIISWSMFNFFWDLFYSIISLEINPPNQRPSDSSSFKKSILIPLHLFFYSYKLKF